MRVIWLFKQLKSYRPNPAQDRQSSKLTHSFVTVSDSVTSTGSTHATDQSTQLTTHCLNAILHNPKSEPYVLGYIHYYPDLNTTGYCLRLRRHDRIPPLVQSVGVKIFGICHLDTKFDFGWGSAMRELTAVPRP